MCANAHYRSGVTRSPLRQRSRAHLRALEALGVFDALSCYLSLISKHSDTKWDLKNTVRSIFFFWGGGAPVAPPSKSATEFYPKQTQVWKQ